MATSSVSSKTPFKGTESRKSSSWWWESHVGRNTKWLAENLEEMEQHYIRMQKLIEGDGDSLAKKADMYYQKRPELLSHVEEFYRMYKSLAERYEHLTGEVRKNIPPDLQSQGSIGSDNSADVTSIWSPQDQKFIHRKSGPRAAGFDFFLGPKKSGYDRPARGDETPSVSDSETEFSESDLSSLYSYTGISVNTGEEEVQSRPLESETESCDVEKMQVQQHEVRNGSLRKISSGIFDDAQSKIADYEDELKTARLKIRQSEEEITSLKAELLKYTTLDFTSNSLNGYPDVESSVSTEKVELGTGESKVLELQENNNTVEVDVSQPEQKVRILSEELRITKGRLQALEKDMAHLRKENKDSSDNMRKMQDLLKVAQKEAATWKAKIESEKRQAAKLQERIKRYKTSLTDRENEVRDLKEVVSDANRRYQLHAEITRLTDEKTHLEEKLREWEMNCHSLETQHAALEKKLNDETELLKLDITEKSQRLEMLETDVDAHKLKYDNLSSEKDELNAELSARNDQIAEMEKRLQQLVAEKDETSVVVQGLSSRVEELREEAERLKVLTLETAEGKREAIRQLCFSLEHYRNNYLHLQQTFMGSKQIHAFAS